MRIALAAAVGRHPAARADAPAAIDGLTLDIAPGEAVAVIGPSGAGKTTLLQLIAAALRPSAGQVVLDGTDPWTLPRAALQRLRGRLFLAPQTPPLPPRQRVVTAVTAGRLPAMGFWQSLAALVHAQDIGAAEAALARFDLADKLFERVDRLSGGERQRVGLARALLSPATLWLVDEPLSALDPARAAQALAALRDEAAARGVTLVASLHQVDAALASFPRVIGLRDGRLAFDLPAAEVTPARLQALYAAREDFAPALEDQPAERALVAGRC
ncbi:phosphonate ABC transporter ATP-binding protein [Rubrivivax benzoatilyticus]|uniref:ATP-binding cassette domain-containing protein n=1 Tax=Rubrivivax benzoatilyticus TaxID=316997 RepID=A0ABX0I0U2_9BURK|nr:ATP-binding cassette domain-containing protein [Rubrivivax benzoatilyticus]EGJ10770.1 ABC transporter-like protein [Rubrivivax benzoatilyticus JA2 = ATCC BAA-35]NHK99461.1 ATP-binding cassette domain-containing protein [Rubrivivax benzoatilyticus]NHL25335.1 ATP-binding cassette domain-containing protein [Rubrivivax benzoatilyticus]